MREDPGSWLRPDPGFEPGVVGFAPPVTYRPRWWLHGTLFAITLFTTTFFGAFLAGTLPHSAAEGSLGRLLVDLAFYREGLKFSIPLLTILLCHEMGHYLACRRHRLLATPPFFIPAPFGIGTFGAVIRIKEPLRDKSQLLDVGVAGPIAGFVALIPFLVYGIAASTVTAIPAKHGFIVFGEPLLFKGIEYLLHPSLASGGDLLMHPVGTAAWFGLLVTALNMLPFAQLDGGHIAYALFGRLHRKAAWPLLLVLFVLGFRWSGWWLWTVIALVLGVRHPRMWDEDRPLDPRRRRVAWLTFVIFVLCFMPNPIRIVP